MGNVRRAALAAVLLFSVAAGCGGGGSASKGGPGGGVSSGQPSSGSQTATTPTTPMTPAPSTPSTTPTTTAPSAPGATSTPAVPTAPLGSPVNLPLWPFASLDQAREWERAYSAGGSQPWHLDAERTALAFTQGYLGFTGIDKTVSIVVTNGRDAHVGVGFATPSTPPRTATAAVIHLVRYGSEPNAPWEVVGTADTTLTLTAPAYGSLLRSPLTVGGAITGVDESIRVQIRTPARAAPLVDRPGLPAGGNAAPWQVTVTVPATTEPVLTVIASTGGHLQAVERFAVTGIRTG